MSASRVRKRQLPAMTAPPPREIVPHRVNAKAERTMETTLLSEIEFDAHQDEDARVHEWRVDQLWRLGIPRVLAIEFAGAVDWHDVAALVRRGCPPLLAVEIAR